MHQTHHCRTLFISDTHLGTADCQAELLLEFLQSTSCETLYLVGDIIDLWQLKSAIYWPRIMNDIVCELVSKANSGTQVIYIPGNHDELLRDFVGTDFNGIQIKLEDTHLTLKGERLLVLHGDALDDTVRTYRWTEALGSNLYDVALAISRTYNRICKRLGYNYWSFAAYIKYKFKNAVIFIDKFEAAAAQLAHHRGYAGVICGHIHHPNNCQYGSVKYYNTGDWVEHCSALAEDLEGNLRVIDWLQMRQLTASDTPASQKPQRLRAA